ncbi:MAG: hypothetical protein KUG82_23365 [Pseudomonadales bacterium]|nr:hypothetical protein [Pseudomonadales bacterium]
MNNNKRKVVESFDVVTKTILLSFAKHECDTKNQILHNFLARTNMMLQAILSLWELGDTQDCWVIHRCMLDRLFHLNDISESNSYIEFEKWSFLQQYKANNKVASDQDFRDKSEVDSITPTQLQKERYAELSKRGNNWRRPKAEKVAKKMNMSFFYKYGYDFGSTHVHPMADDGQEDFYNITGLEPRPKFPDQSMVFSNSVVVATMIAQDVLNYSNLNWAAVTYNYLERVRESMNDENYMEYEVDVARIGILFMNSSLCKPKIS